MNVATKGLVQVLVFLSITFSSACVFALPTNFISAPNRVDMVHDGTRGILFITNGSSVLRYKLATSSFLTPYTFTSASLSGIDLSPDGNTLAVADRNLAGIHLIDLTTDTIKPDIVFARSSGEGGSFTVAYGGDGVLLVTTQYNGSGWVPLRRIDPASGAVTVLQSSIGQDSMLSASADGRFVAIAQSNDSSGPVSIYDVQSYQVTNTANTSRYNYEVGASRDCTQLAVPTYGGTFIYGSTLTKLGTIGVYAGGQPIGAVYHPSSDLVYFSWAGSQEVRAYDTKNFTQRASFNVGDTFQTPGNHAFTQGRLKISRDGSLLFVSVANGISWQLTAPNPVAQNQSLLANRAAPTIITLTGSSPKQLPITYTVLTQPSHGTLIGTAPSLTYTPATFYTGTDSFTFKTSDGTLDSAPATVSIIIDKSPPAITSFTMPATSSTLTVPVSSLAASDNVGVSGYCLTPQMDPTSCSWSSNAPASYHFSSTGTKVLFAFARDASGNVSNPASVTVDLPILPPQITTFSIPATYAYGNLNLPVTLTASDEVGVTGYCLTESADPAGCSWSSAAPTSYTLAAAGPHILYAFARNGTGYLSAPASASTTVVGKVDFIPAASRVDLVHDSKRNVVYITDGTSVLRYQLDSCAFLPPYVFGLGSLTGIDISPDGNTLAVADQNFPGIHLIDLASDTIKPDVSFSPGTGEAGTYSVAFGSDGALLVSSRYYGSGSVPLRRVDPATGAVSVIKSSITQDAMLSASADGTCIAYEESNISSGPASVYDVATRSVTKTFSTNWFAYEVGANRDCSQFAVPTYGGTFILDGTLAKIGSIGVYAAGQPLGVAYHPLSDVVYFAWAGASEVRAYDTKTLTQLRSFDLGHIFQTNGNSAYVDGRMKTTRDGSMLFVSVADGVRYQRLTDSPIANDQAIATYSGVAIPLSLVGNGTSKAALTYTITTQPAHGSLQGSAPNLVYTPDAGYFGMDSIAFKVNDGTKDSNVAVMTLTVKPIPGDVAISPPVVKGVLSISWTTPADPDFDHITIYRSTAAGSLGSLIADQLSGTGYNDTGLAALTTYYYTVRSVEHSGAESTNTPQVFEKTLEAFPPVTLALPGAGAYGQPQTVTLFCYDLDSGCAATYYCLGSGCSPTTPYSNQGIVVATSTELRYFSTDRTGNVEAVNTTSFTIQPHFITVAPAALNLGTASSNATVSAMVTISNQGTLPLVLTAPLSSSGTDSAQFTLAPGGTQPCSSLQPTLVPGASCTVTVSFTPVSLGAKQAYLRIASNAENSPSLTLPLAGTGVPPAYLTTLITGSGSVSVIAPTGSYSCSASNCTSTFAVGSSVTLKAAPAATYTFSGWSGACSGLSNCSLTLAGNTSATAGFTALPLVRVEASDIFYRSLSDALADVFGVATVRLRNVSFTEDIRLDRSHTVALIGGLQDDFATEGGTTVLYGKLTISQGTLTVTGLTLR